MTGVARATKRRRRRALLRAADKARDEKKWRVATSLYERVLAHDPGQLGVRVQLGHMRKEAGNLVGAEEAYQAVLDVTPDDDDLHVQMGHLRKLQGDLDAAFWHYQRALELAPANAAAQVESDALLASSRAWTPGPAPVAPPPHEPQPGPRSSLLRAAGRLTVTSLTALDDSYFAADIVSFDLFDTLIRRRYLAANEVHDTVSAYVLAMLGQFGKENPGKLTLTRYNTTNNLKTSLHSNSEEPSLPEIWTQIIGARIGHGDQATALALRAAAFEYEIDCENLTAVHGAAELLTRLKGSGKQIIAVSDMYFSAAEIDHILTLAGLRKFFDHVFVSCEVKSTKQTGNLFRHVCRSLAVAPADIVHIGDNQKSDVEIPAALGIKPVHIHQPELLKLERPAYGRRPDIHVEVADLVKLFAIQMLLYAKSDRAEHIYFLSRDGCLINRVLDAWQSPLLSHHLDDVKRSDFFLSRATSCWLGTNFRGEWLAQSIGHAFWLHLGQASARQISALLGIDEVPAALGDSVYRSDRDTDLVVDAYEAAGLSPKIRSSLMAKRAMVERYLQDCGFYDQTSIMMCDVGYSGTVVRDLNTYFLQESGRPGRRLPPHIDFHLIASNANYAINALAGAPYVTFNDRPVLPASRMPQSLADSFAWLEMFFKHPTFGPLLGYAEVDGRMVPWFDTLPDPGADHPSARVLAQTGACGSDIALLWMASTNFWDQFIDPLLNRFANPDHETVLQMLDDVYETDAVTRQTRSVVLIADGMSDQEIYEAAKTLDYWIPGSLFANAHMRDIAVREARRAEASAATWADEPGLHQPARLDLANAPDAFDPKFYRAFHDDLRALPDDALREHYRLHGRREGRYRSAAHMRAALTAIYGPLPSGFNHTAYLWANPDLVPHDPPRWHAEMHYLKLGRQEGRPLQPRLDDLDREFEALAAANALAFSADEQTEWTNGACARAIVFRRHPNIGPGPWLAILDLSEFVALNYGWCGPLPSKAAAVEAFLRTGIDRLASLSLASCFDPVFYRAQYLDASDLSDVMAYRHWITDGSLLGHAPSEAHRLQRMIGADKFPSCFDWQAFLRRHARRLSATASRTDVLEAFLAFGSPDEPGNVAGEGEAALWAIFAQRAADHGNSGSARLAYRKALSAGGPGGRIWHKLGDLAFNERDFHGAVAAYLEGIAQPSPDRWSYVNGMMAASEIGAFQTGLQFLDAGRPAWRDMEPWRRARTGLLEAWYRHRYDAIDAGRETDPVAAADAFVSFIDMFTETVCRHLPPPLPLGRSDGHVVLLTGHTLHDRARAAVQTRPVTLQHGRRLNVFSRHEVQLFTESLLGASMAILHEVNCDCDIVQAILLARVYGVRTLFWIGELGRWKEAGIDLSDLTWDSFMAEPAHNNHGRTLTSLYAASLCDASVTTMPALLPPLAAISKAHLAPGRRPSLVRNPQGVADPLYILVHLPDPHGVKPRQAAHDGLAATLQALLEARPQTRLLIEGTLPDGHALNQFPERVTCVQPKTRMMRVLPLEGLVDLAVDLTTSQDDYRCRWADAAHGGVPCVVGATRVLAWMTSGADAVSTTGNDDLLQALLSLVDAPEERRCIGAAARSLFERQFDRAAESSSTHPPVHRTAPQRKRILYANVFFPPQTIGGATRVLKDNVDHVLDTADDRYELAVFASDDENNQRAATRCDAYRGVPVFRIATPQEIDMDWRMHNAEVGSYARRVLDLYRPDLVHIHCLQRLSVAFAEACQMEGYPYVVTLHDAWWLSDYSFLVDEEGRLCLPKSDILGQPYSRRIGLSASAQRADRLRRALHGATERLSVSEPFAEIYRRAGFTVRTIANGVSPLGPVARIPSSGRVRLGHIGGTQHHKGAYLVEAALRAQHFDNLSLTIIELARDSGNETHTVWGNTPVSIIGKVGSDKIAELYASLDVLLAPSTWPESFGLVSREAASCGLWVVASDQGAMGEGVISDRNGYIIDVQTPEGLIEALRGIDANPARFSESPPLCASMRTAADQGRDIVALYDTLMAAAP